jgi:hypothetical protein
MGGSLARAYRQRGSSQPNETIPQQRDSFLPAQLRFVPATGGLEVTPLMSSAVGSDAMTMQIVESMTALKDLVGREVGVSDWFVVSQERITQFAETIASGFTWIASEPNENRHTAPPSHTVS